MTDSKDYKAAAEPPLDCLVMPLSDSELMLTYMAFDRHADEDWDDITYLLEFGKAVSEKTLDPNRQNRRFK